MTPKSPINRTEELNPGRGKFGQLMSILALLQIQSLHEQYPLEADQLGRDLHRLQQNHQKPRVMRKSAEKCLV